MARSAPTSRIRAAPAIGVSREPATRPAAWVLAAAGALAVCTWLWQLAEDPLWYGQDAAEYTIVAARLASGSSDALLWNGVTGPALPSALAALMELGLSPPGAARVLAFASYASLLVAAAAFAFALARDLGCGVRTGLLAGAVVVASVGLNFWMLRLLLLPLTDAPSLAALLLALALVRVAATRAWCAAGLGVCAAAAYLFRYSALNAALGLVGVAAVHAAIQWRGGRCSGTRLAATGVLLAAPLALAVPFVAAKLTGPERGFSFGANTMVAAFVAGEERTDAYPTPFWAINGLNDDGTLGIFRVEPDDELSWSPHWWQGRTAAWTTGDTGAASSLWQRVVEPGGAQRATRALLGSWGAFEPAMIAAGAAIGLALLATHRGRSSPVLWAAGVLAGSVVAGLALVHHREARFLWGPAVVFAALVPCGVALGIARARGPSRQAHRAVARLAAVGAGVAAALLVLGLARSGARLASETSALRRSQEPESRRALARALAPVREASARAVAEGALPFSTPTVGSSYLGLAFPSGARWIPLASVRPPLTGWEAAPLEQKRLALRRLVDFMQRARVQYVALVERDFVTNPILRPLFNPRERLPAGFRLLADVENPVADRPSLARVLELRARAR